MKRATIVIGAAFGDEGKGHIVDYLSSLTKNAIVVRFNGGAQAAHTVKVGDLRHVFHHFGSGTLAGLPTYLTERFLVNPLAWVAERNVLHYLNEEFYGEIHVHANAEVTTVFDILLNQWAEQARANRHGSCGMGINETVTRKEAGYSLQVRELGNRVHLHEKLDMFLSVWVPVRIEQLGLKLNETQRRILQNPQLRHDYIEACLDFDESTQTIRNETEFLENMDHVIFEGAQGLLLDEEHEFFPHVTRSKTGTKWVADILEPMERREVNLIYVLRSYMTRHGAGPFPTEDITVVYEDKTNHPNDWQGGLRFGRLDMELIGEALNRDIEAFDKRNLTNRTPMLAITCLDQCEIDVNQVAKDFGLKLFLTSHGPDRKDIRQHG